MAVNLEYLRALLAPAEFHTCTERRCAAAFEGAPPARPNLKTRVGVNAVFAYQRFGGFECESNLSRLLHNRIIYLNLLSHNFIVLPCHAFIVSYTANELFPYLERSQQRQKDRHVNRWVDK